MIFPSRGVAFTTSMYKMHSCRSEIQYSTCMHVLLHDKMAHVRILNSESLIAEAELGSTPVIRLARALRQPNGKMFSVRKS